MHHTQGFVCVLLFIINLRYVGCFFFDESCYNLCCKQSKMIKWLNTLSSLVLLFHDDDDDWTVSNNRPWQHGFNYVGKMYRGCGMCCEPSGSLLVHHCLLFSAFCWLLGYKCEHSKSWAGVVREHPVAHMLCTVMRWPSFRRRGGYNTDDEAGETRLRFRRLPNL